MKSDLLSDFQIDVFHINGCDTRLIASEKIRLYDAVRSQKNKVILPPVKSRIVLIEACFYGELSIWLYD